MIAGKAPWRGNYNSRKENLFDVSAKHTKKGMRKREH